MALSAGCGCSSASAVVSPSYDTPYIPTLPLLFGTFLDQPVDAVVGIGGFVRRLGIVQSTCDESLKVPSDLNRPRRFWMTKM